MKLGSSHRLSLDIEFNQSFIIRVHVFTHVPVKTFLVRWLKHRYLYDKFGSQPATMSPPLAAAGSSAKDFKRESAAARLTGAGQLQQGPTSCSQY